jgi:hypothetical protein
MEAADRVIELSAGRLLEAQAPASSRALAEPAGVA